MQIGLIAGAGELPIIIATDARARGYRVVTVALENIASPDLAGVSDVIRWINPGKFGELIDTLKKNSVDKALMAGKVQKSLLYKSKIVPDLRGVKLLFSIINKGDDVILNAIKKELDDEGIEIIDTLTFSPHLLTPEGCLTKKRPDEEEWKDIEYGWKIAKEIGRLDIGQVVVVKGQSIMAVEAIEGTDEAILRGGELGGEGAVVVKISKPQQDMRLDVPAVGLDTIGVMRRVKAAVLAVEANKSIIVNIEKVIKEAQAAGIKIVGITGERFADSAERKQS
jgi:UDP-2,3-diacylglucosamine hydrolase